MASLKEVRTRIASVNSTKQITSAMKMVSASKLRKTQNSIIKLKPYSRKMNEILQNLCNAGNNNVSFFKEREEVNNILVVVVASNRGMCGVFNTAIIKATLNLINEKYSEYNKADKLSLMCIGKKAAEFFTKRQFKVQSIHNDLLDNLNYENASLVAKNIMNDFENQKYDKVIVVYNYFKNAAVQVIQAAQFLPFVPDFKGAEEINHDYILEPEKQHVISELVPRTLKLKFYEYILNSYVSEHGARMTAMHKATDNATELLKNLKLSYNKVRQASITGEILEIVGGADALS